MRISNQWAGAASRMKRHRALAFAAILAACVGCDHATKHAAEAVLAGGASIALLGDAVRLELAHNFGAFLSLGQALPEALRHLLFVVLLPGLLALVCCAALRSGVSSRGALVALGLVAGGGVGNWLDRLLNAGAVTDFVRVELGPLRTGVFNVADVFIVAGIALFAFSSSRAGRPRTGGRAASLLVPIALAAAAGGVLAEPARAQARIEPLSVVVIKSSTGPCMRDTICHKDKAGVWIPDTDVAIVSASVPEQADVDLYVDIEISTAPEMYLTNGHIFRVKYIGPRLFSYGATSGNTYLGSNVTTTNISFPTGYGIRIARGTPVYVHIDARNQSLVDLKVDQDAYLYYVPLPAAP